MAALKLACANLDDTGKEPKHKVQADRVLNFSQGHWLRIAEHVAAQLEDTDKDGDVDDITDKALENLVATHLQRLGDRLEVA
mgnify:FL=1